MKTRRSNDRILMAHPCPVWILDDRISRILACNPAASRLLCLSEGEIVGRAPAEVGLDLDEARVLGGGSLIWHQTEWKGSLALLVLADPAVQAPAKVPDRLALRQDIVARVLPALRCAVIETDLQTGNLRFSPEAFEVLGLPETARALTVPDLMAMVHPEDVERYKAEREASLLSGTMIDTTVRLIPPGGSIRHLRVIAGPSGSDDGETRYSLVQDVTDFALLTERQRQTEALLELASRMAKLGGWRSDIDTGRVEATSGVYEIYAMPSDGPFHNNAALSCFAPSDHAELLAARTATIEGSKIYEGDFAITALDGVKKWVRVCQAPEFGSDGRITALVGAAQDITEIVALRSEAEAQALRLKSTIQNMPDAFFLFDPGLRFTYANPVGLEMLGVPQLRPDELLGRTLWDLRPDLEPRMGPVFEELLATGKPVSTLVELEGFSSIRRVDAHLTPDGIGVHVRDVTGEIQARKALEASEERYRLAFTASQDVIFEWQIPDDVLTWSEIAQERFGYDPKIFPRNIADWLSILHPGDRERMMQAADISKGQGQQAIWTSQYRLKRADGTFAHVLDRSLSVLDPNGRPMRMIGTITDVTSLREEEQRLRAIAEVASDAIYEYDPRRQVMTFSEGLRTTFGHDWVGEQKIPTPWQEMMHAEDREARIRDFQAFAAGDQRLARYEYRMMRADGSYATVRERAVALRDDEGHLIRIIGSLEDITLERQAEARMKQAERVEAIGKLTGGVAHDFNNLLTVILGNAELLETASSLDDGDRELASIIVQAAERGSELTAGLLAFAGQQPLAPRTIDMRSALDEIGRLLQRTLPADIALEIVARPNLWLVEADPAKMNAAILNLAVNARDAMPEGGKLLIECVNAHLDEAYVEANPAARSGDFLRVAVTDTGTGMSPEVVKRVFEPFFTTKPKGTGTGMGLSMVHGFVQQSGGHVKVYTEPGQGTTISLYLPRSGAAHADPGREDDLITPVGHGEHVLVVEDNELLLPHVAEMVKGLGYRVSLAADARGALAILQESRDVDILFTDVVMPGEMNGAVLAKRAQADFPDLKILFTSGYTENAIFHHGRLDPGVHLLSKPYRRHELAAKLRHVIEAAP